jgi:glycosyltransferase involved in cell wall biosynthesis
VRIAFVTSWYPPDIEGGAGVYADNITRELAKLGHEILVLAPGPAGHPHEFETNHTLSVIRLSPNRRIPFDKLLFWAKLPKAIRILEDQRKFDLIHVNGISYWGLKRLSSAPHLWTVHHLARDAVQNERADIVWRLKNIGSETGPFVPFIEGRCLENADAITAVSNHTAGRLVEVYKIQPEKINVIHNGVADEEYTFSNYELLDFRRELNLENRPTILFVGRVDDARKGLDLILRTLKRILCRIDVNFLVVGGGNPKRMKELAMNLNVSNNVFFTGFLNRARLRKSYAICDVYVCPSRLEGFGLTLLEAMAAGKPIVAHNVGSIGEIIRDGENGTLVDLNDEDGFSRAVFMYLVDDNLARITGARNKQLASRKFTWQSSACKLDELMRAIVARNRNSPSSRNWCVQSTNH